MGIARDFLMYYGDTYVGVRGEGEEILPFHVCGVEYQDWFREEANRQNVPFDHLRRGLYQKHEQVVQALQFSGTVISGESGNRDHRVCSMADLILENPDLGYIKCGNTWRWVAYTPQQSAKKGLLVRRITHQTATRSDIYKLFNIRPEGERLHKDVILTENYLGYKGVSIGTVEDQVITIGSQFEIMDSFITSILPQGYEVVYD